MAETVRLDHILDKSLQFVPLQHCPLRDLAPIASGWCMHLHCQRANPVRNGQSENHAIQEKPMTSLVQAVHHAYQQSSNVMSRSRLAIVARFASMTVTMMCNLSANWITLHTYSFGLGESLVYACVPSQYLLSKMLLLIFDFGRR